MTENGELPTGSEAMDVDEPGEELEHLLVRLAELVPVRIALDNEGADDLAADAQRHAQPDERWASDHVHDALLDPLVELLPVDHSP